nr:hypothetical protein [Nevskia sp.]
MLAQPAIAAAAEPPHQLPVRAHRRLIAGLEIELGRGDGRGLVVVLDQLHRRVEAIAEAVHRLEPQRTAGTERLAHAGDAVADHRFVDHTAGPQRFQQFVLGDQFAGMPQQQHQHVQRFRFQRQQFAVAAQFAAGFVQLESTKAPACAVQRRPGGLTEVRFDLFRHPFSRPESCSPVAICRSQCDDKRALRHA